MSIETDKAAATERVAAEAMKLLDEHDLLPELRRRLDVLEVGDHEQGASQPGNGSQR